MRVPGGVGMHDLRSPSAALPNFRLPQTLSHVAQTGQGQSGETAAILAVGIQCGPGTFEKSEPGRAEGMFGKARRVFQLSGMFCELLSKPDNVFMRRRPIRVARIAVEYQCVRFQLGFEFFLAECHRLVMVVRTYDFEIYTVAHEFPR